MTPILVFDIETVPDVAGVRRLRPTWAELPDAEVAQRVFDERRERTGSDFLPLHLHRVVAIACAFRDDAGFRVRSVGQPGDDEAEHRGGQHRARGGQPGADQPDGAGPVVVGAADAVGVVVGVVDTDDQRDRNHKGQSRFPPHLTADPGGGTGACQHGGDGIREGPRSGALYPLRKTGHARNRPTPLHLSA